MNFLSHDWRDRRNFLNQGISFGPMHHTIANYSIDKDTTKKPDMEVFEENIFTKIHSIPDPLKKNLADTVITGMNKDKTTLETPVEEKEFYYETNIGPPISETMEIPTNVYRRDFYQSLTGITSFISNVFGTISGAMFYRRPKSPVSQCYDCFDSDSRIAQEMASEDWQTSNLVDQNKKRAEQCGMANGNMNNCKAAVAQVEGKISAVRDLLSSKTVPQTAKTTRVRYRRPRRAFVEPGSVSDSYEEDSTAENYVSLANDEYIEYFAVPNNQEQLFCDIEAAKMKIELGIVPENTDIVKIIPDVTQKVESSTPTVINNVEPDETIKKEVIASCEDKVAKLKALLLERRKKPSNCSESTDSNAESTNDTQQKPIKKTKVIPIEKKHDKRFKNPCRLTDKRRKSKLKNNIQDDTIFASEIDSEDISSAENSPAATSSMQRIPKKMPIPTRHTQREFFDEVTGRFHSSSVDSDDSFQIVFADSPKLSRMRRPSDCDSEDSFIVFEDAPDSCFTSNDVFDGHSTEESDDDSVADSDISDSGCAVDVCKLSHSLSRTVSDLTDTSLYDDSEMENTNMVEDIVVSDEVDCAVRCNNVCKELSPVKEESPEIDCEPEGVSRGLLIDEAKKLRRKSMPPKTVTFSDKPPKVHVMRVWSFAARQARAGQWERYSLDRERFKRRIADVDMAISWVLKPQHRSRVMFQRFMPWWNKQRRIEAAEKKKRDEEEKIRKEEERKTKEREGFIVEYYNQEIDEIQSYEDEFFVYIKSVIEDEVKDKQEKAIQAIMELKNFKHKKKKVKTETGKEKNTDKTKNVQNNDGKVSLKCR